MAWGEGALREAAVSAPASTVPGPQEGDERCGQRAAFNRTTTSETPEILIRVLASWRFLQRRRMLWFTSSFTEERGDTLREASEAHAVSPATVCSERGCPVTWSAERWTQGSASGHGLRVLGRSPAPSSGLSREPARGSFSSSAPPCLCAHVRAHARSQMSRKKRCIQNVAFQLLNT